MEISDSPRPAQSEPRGQKRFRKGTHSCTECRRRKIRCVFTPENATCAPCSARGSRCIDQRGGVARELPNKSTEYIETSGQIPARDPHSSSISSDINQGYNEADCRPPLVEAIERAYPSSHAHNLPTSSSELGGSTDQRNTNDTNQINSTCATLRSLLPSYDKVLFVCSRNGAWWNSFRYKTNTITQAPVESITAFIARTYTSPDPAHLGMLVTAYVRSSGETHNRLLDNVDALVLSNSLYAATVRGLECLILQAKTFTDLGQPRRAWFTWRKGLATAQLMGLYRDDADATRQMIWWAIYHGDRFTSMLLGLPYGFNDAHYGPVEKLTAYKSGTAEHRLIFQSVFIAGKVIDRNVTPGTISFAKAMELDEQMDAVYLTMPEEWWDPPDDLSNLISGPQADMLRERLLVQFYFFYVRMYIHLPFISKPTSRSFMSCSQQVCMEAARQMLIRHRLLSSEVQETCLFECKTSDFVAFTAAVALLLGHSSSIHLADDQQHHQDLDLVSEFERRLDQSKRTSGCVIASQCSRTLGMLRGTPSVAGAPRGIHIPYFGIVIQKPTDETQARVTEGGDRGASAATQPELTASETIPTPSSENQPALPDFPIEYWGSSMLYPSCDGTQTGPDLLGGLQSEDWSSFFDYGSFDIDQEWRSFPGALEGTSTAI